MNRVSNEFWADLARGCLKCQSHNVIITLFEALGMHFICFCVASSVETALMLSLMDSSGGMREDWLLVKALLIEVSLLVR